MPHCTAAGGGSVGGGYFKHHYYKELVEHRKKTLKMYLCIYVLQLLESRTSAPLVKVNSLASPIECLLY